MKNILDYIKSLNKSEYSFSDSGALFFNRSILSQLKSDNGQRQLKELEKLRNNK